MGGSGCLYKETLKNREKDGKRLNPIIKRKLGSKEKRMVYTSGGRPGEAQTKNIDTSDKERSQYSLENSEVIKSADWACLIEDHYSKIHGEPTPMDVSKIASLYYFFESLCKI
jgi:phosphoenolpyruvate synthase/pyruvate phosphate dikinase